MWSGAGHRLRARQAGGRRGPGNGAVPDRHACLGVTPASATSLPDRRPAPRHVALPARHAGRRGWTDPSRPRPGHRGRALGRAPRCRRPRAGRLAGTESRVRQAHRDGVWRREALQVPCRHRSRGRRWLNEGKGLRPLQRKHVLRFDGERVQTGDGWSPHIPALLGHLTLGLSKGKPA